VPSFLNVVKNQKTLNLIPIHSSVLFSGFVGMADNVQKILLKRTKWSMAAKDHKMLLVKKFFG
jgi:hypothetical protein